ncbi:unnamed protein product [marine sediment metagenome]|uniref:Uncharacterized protein n=1 Tax=marine sediment metagenome TaxID=412755 RepID=X1FAA0_9ZZZZ
MKSKTEQIKNLLEEIEKIMKELNIPDEIIEREVLATGNSAHITIPKKHLNKKAIVIINK